MKKIIKIFLMLLILNVSNVYADEKVTLQREKYNNVYAVYDGLDRIHLYEAERYIFNENTAYCIEIGLPISTNAYLSTDNLNVTGLSQDTLNYIRLAAYYGYDYTGHKSMKYYLAAQELIWRKISGRNIYWIQGTDINGLIVNVDNEKKQIEQLIANHYILPSFNGKTIDLKMGETLKIKDSNKVLSTFDVSNSKSLNVSVDNDTLTISSNKYQEETNIKLIKKNYTNSVTLIYYSGINQKMIKSGILEPLYATVNVHTTFGAKIKLTKIDKESGKPIHKKGIKFKIKDTISKEYICAKTCIYETSEDGSFITDTILEKGNYQVEELEDQDFDYYLWNKTPLVFQIDEESNITYLNSEPVIELNFQNTYPKGVFEIAKYGEEPVFKNNNITYNKILLDGITFDLFAQDDIKNQFGEIIYHKNDIISTINTTNGKYKIENLFIGDYCIVEKRTLNNYELNNNPHCFSIKYIDKYTKSLKQKIFFQNYLKKGTFELQKVSSNNNAPLKGAQIEIRNEANEIVYLGNTDDNGKIIIKELPAGKYYYKEIIAPLGYALNNESKPFEIKEKDEVVKVILINDLITGTFDFTKIDYNTNTPLLGAKIAIYNEDDTLYAEEVTDSNGKITITNIPYGKYYFKEISAPSGYILNNAIYHFEISEMNEIIKAEMENEKINVPNTNLDKNYSFIYLSVSLFSLGALLIYHEKKNK